MLRAMLMALQVFGFRLLAGLLQLSTHEDPVVAASRADAAAVVREEGYLRGLFRERAGYEARVEAAKAADDKATQKRYEGRIKAVDDQIAQAEEKIEASRARVNEVELQRARRAAGVDVLGPRRSDQTPAELAVQRAGVPPAGSETFETYPGEGPPRQAISGQAEAQARAMGQPVPPASAPPGVVEAFQESDQFPGTPGAEVPLEDLKMDELKELADREGVEGSYSKKADLIDAIEENRRARQA